MPVLPVTLASYFYASTALSTFGYIVHLEAPPSGLRLAEKLLLASLLRFDYRAVRAAAFRFAWELWETCVVGVRLLQKGVLDARPLAAVGTTRLSTPPCDREPMVWHLRLCAVWATRSRHARNDFGRDAADPRDHVAVPCGGGDAGDKQNVEAALRPLFASIERAALFATRSSRESRAYGTSTVDRTSELVERCPQQPPSVAMQAVRLPFNGWT